jgi:hypothetical protein
MSTLPRKPHDPQLPQTVVVDTDGRVESLSGDQLDAYVATGEDARRLFAQLKELAELRLKGSGGTVFKRARSHFWQIKFRDDTGRWRYKSIRTAKTKREAEWWLSQKVLRQGRACCLERPVSSRSSGCS